MIDLILDVDPDTRVAQPDESQACESPDRNDGAADPALIAGGSLEDDEELTRQPYVNASAHSVMPSLGQARANTRSLAPSACGIRRWISDSLASATLR